MTSKRSMIGCAALACAAAAVHAQAMAPQADRSTLAPAVTAAQPVHTPAMQALRESAQRLRESIQQIARAPAGPERRVALDQARAALLRTQQAMLDLPPSDRAAGTVSSTAGYDASVKKLMAAADTLRDAIQEMAAQPAGPRRNQAIRDANRALLETQGAMANAYDVTAFPQHHASASVDVESMDCVRLRSMTACHPG